MSSHPLGSGWDVIVNTTGLLESMVGPSSTLRKPDVAPAQIVMEMDVALHELTIIGKSFKTTKLELCVVPKLEPVIVTCVPIGPVVAETELMIGGMFAAE